MNLNDLELSHGTCSACGREDSSMQRLGRLVFDVLYVGFAAGYWVKVQKEMGK